jgi:hypothetical protein
LVAQQKSAQAADARQIQQSLGQDTQSLWNMFGSGTQLAYVSIPGVGVNAGGGAGLTPPAASGRS